MAWKASTRVSTLQSRTSTQKSQVSMNGMNANHQKSSLYHSANSQWFTLSVKALPLPLLVGF